MLCWCVVRHVHEGTAIFFQQKQALAACSCCEWVKISLHVRCFLCRSFYSLQPQFIAIPSCFLVASGMGVWRLLVWFVFNVHNLSPFTRVGLIWRIHERTWHMQNPTHCYLVFCLRDWKVFNIMIWVVVEILDAATGARGASVIRFIIMMFWTCALLTLLQIFSVVVAQECTPCDCNVVDASVNCSAFVGLEDPCDCCLRCNRQVGEACGGVNGRCATGLFCLPDNPYAGEEGSCYG